MTENDRIIREAAITLLNFGVLSEPKRDELARALGETGE